MMNFKNKKILVTGASSGIGRQIAIQLSELGAIVVLVGRDEARLNESLNLMANPSVHKAFVYDLQNIDDIMNFVKDALADGVKFDGLVHAAGVPAIYPIKVLDYEIFEKAFKINAYSFIELIKQISKKQNSNDNVSAVFISSVLTKTAAKGQLPYIVSKGAFNVAAKSISNELSKRNFRLNTIITGAVMTKMVKETDAYRMLRDEIQILPDSFKILSANEVASMTIFLLSDSARYIIGENYFMDGGYF